MSEPRFGNCRDCAAWQLNVDRQGRRECYRRAPIASLHITALDYPAAKWPRTAAHDGCFDHIPALPSPPETDNG